MIEPNTPSGANGNVGESETGSPRDHDEQKPLDVVPGVGPRVDTPSGAGAGRVGGSRTPAGQLAGHDASHENGSVRDERTCRSRWLASRKPAGTDDPGQHGRADESRLRSEAREGRSDAWTGGCPMIHSS
jgi:hypothetical protein